MTTLNVIIIDDERRVRNHLKNTLAECADVTVVGEADSLPSARHLLAEHPDIDGIFLDIQLPGGTGFDIVPDISDMQCVVFVTAFDQYALRAFEVNALDYLMKPVTPERLEQSLKRLRAHKETRVTTENNDHNNSHSSAHDAPNAGHHSMTGKHLLVSGETLHFGAPLHENDQLLLKFGSKNKFCLVKDIVFVRSADNYTEVHCSDGSVALMRKTLEEWATSLPSAMFVRIHRSVLVNIGYIAETEQEAGGRLVIRLRGKIEEELVVSRSYAPLVKEALLR